MKDTEQSTLVPARPRFSRDDEKDIEDFGRMVLAFYAKNRRDLPWRHTTDPYCILISEIMLQQTQVDRVIKKYPLFLEAFPDFSTLAGCTAADVYVWRDGIQSPGYRLR